MGATPSSWPCASCCCAWSSARVFVHPSAPKRPADDARRSLDFLLLPYTAMGWRCPGVLLLLLLKVARSQGLYQLRTEIAKRRERLGRERSIGAGSADSISRRPSCPTMRTEAARLNIQTVQRNLERTTEDGDSKRK